MPATMDAWGGAELTALVNDVDYSCFVLEVDINRSRNRIWDPPEAGSCDLRINLAGGDVPADTGDLGEVVKVKIAYGSVNRWLFTGRVQYRHIEIRPTGDVLVLNCVDEFQALARVNHRAGVGDTPAYGGEHVQFRIERWLDAAGSTTSRLLDSSDYTCPATLIDGNTLLQIQATALADGGDFFVAGDGTLTFKAWAWQVTADTADCMFSDRHLYPFVPYTVATWANDLDEVQNDVTATRRPVDDTDVPVPQHVTNPASITAYGHQGDALDNLELEDDTQTVNRASAWVEIAAYPNPRFDSIIVDPVLDPPLSWPLVIPVAFSSLVVCNRRFDDGTEISRYGHVIGERWRLTPNTAEVEYRCSGTGTWDATRPPRPPIVIEPCPDGSIRVPANYPCNDTCNVVLKDCSGAVLVTYPPGSLCTCGVVFPPTETCMVCYDCGDGLEQCFDYTDPVNTAILWLDAVDEVPDRMIDKKDHQYPFVGPGFGSTTLNVWGPSTRQDAINATFDGGLIAHDNSPLVAATNFNDGWTIDFGLNFANPTTVTDPTAIIDLVDLGTVIVAATARYMSTGPYLYQLDIGVVHTVSGVPTITWTGPIATIPDDGAWHHWVIYWDGTANLLVVLLDGTDIA